MKKQTSEAPIKKITLRQQLIDYFVHKIESGEYKSGDRITNEIALAEQLQISRNILREAMKVLEDFGILITVNGKGTEVSANAPANIQSMRFFEKLRNNTSVLQLLDTRLMIEPQIARIACQRSTQEELDNLKKADFARLDLHLAIAQMCKNDVLLEFMNTITLHLRCSDYFLLRDYASNSLHQKSGKEHEAIIAAIVNRDEDKAASLIQQHLSDRIYAIQTLYNTGIALPQAR